MEALLEVLFAVIFTNWKKVKRMVFKKDRNSQAINN